MDGLRRDHFPRERNLLPAHLTLFHRLSSAQTARLSDLAVPGDPVPIHSLLLLGFGVAVRIGSTRFEQLQVAARDVMRGEFSRQDSQTWRPHFTIQNKVTPDAAQRLHGDHRARTQASRSILIRLCGAEDDNKRPQLGVWWS
ncbi:2'-5' RNA ligase family protein [Bradyrhizobium monzae]